MELISLDEIKKINKWKGPGAHFLARVLMRTFQYDKINYLYDKHKNLKNFQFIDAILKDIGIRAIINHSEISRIPVEGSFIIVSNHPYGGVEGLILLNIIKNIRPDIKVMANFLFHKIYPIKDLIIPVNPFEQYESISSFKGIKEAINHLDEGHPLIIFPAGEVSTYYNGNNTVADRKWKKSIVKFIKKAKVPIIPVFFGGTNSPLFHFLGKIHPALRTARLPAELLNKKNKKIFVRIGTAIPVKEQEKFDNITLYGRYLRARVYALNTELEIKNFFSVFKIKTRPSEIIQPIEVGLLEKEIKDISFSYKLFEHGSMHVFCAPPDTIPNILNEIGRLREVTFRLVGEGTNQSCDLDEYDLYYHHLFIWSIDEKKIIGAYRLGFGDNIYLKYGIKGFYTRSLFKYKKEIYPVFRNCIELGRSFIIKEHQRSPLPLYLLWKGIFYTLIKNSQYKYLIGPVSISNEYSIVSKKIIMDYMMKHHFNKELAKYVKPRKKLKVNLPNLDTDIISQVSKELVNLDKLISDVEQDRFKIPVLLKKYLQLNGKIVAFNLDPRFNNALDGLLILNVNDIPDDIIQYLSRS